MLQITVFHKNQEISILMIKKIKITVENYKVFSVPAKSQEPSENSARWVVANLIKPELKPRTNFF